jgi:SAM-dependent methyltransferase
VSGPTRDFWEERFRTGHTPWDRGQTNPQLGEWLAARVLTPCRILVPGCGSGYEVAALAAAGFEVTGIDYSAEAIGRARDLIESTNVTAHLTETDVLAWEPDRPFDAIYEQTCLCALYPDHWRDYADRLRRWLVPGGSLYALFVQWLRPGAAEGLIEGPPYHCDVNAMRALFPEPGWHWPKPPYPRTMHPRGLVELAVVLVRRD